MVFEKSAARLLDSMIFPMPSSKGRGVIVFKSGIGRHLRRHTYDN